MVSVSLEGLRQRNYRDCIRRGDVSPVARNCLTSCFCSEVAKSLHLAPTQKAVTTKLPEGNSADAIDSGATAGRSLSRKNARAQGG